MERFLNKAGPNRLEEQYTIAPQSRIDLDDVLMLIRQNERFANDYVKLQYCDP